MAVIQATDANNKPQPVLCDAQRRIITSPGSAGGTGYTRLVDGTGATLAAISAAGATFAATINGLVSRAATYLWNGSNWTRALSDTSGRLEIAGYATATVSTRVEEIDPISAQHLEETLGTVAVAADGTTKYTLDMDGYNRADFQMLMTPGTGTISVYIDGTLQDNGAGAASCTYTDMTSEYGTAVITVSASGTQSTFLAFDEAQNSGGCKFVRVRVQVSGFESGVTAFTVYAKRRAV